MVGTRKADKLEVAWALSFPPPSPPLTEADVWRVVGQDIANAPHKRNSYVHKGTGILTEDTDPLAEKVSRPPSLPPTKHWT